MPIDKKKEIKVINEKEVDFFIDRLAEILLMQLGKDQPKPKKQNEKKGRQKLQFPSDGDVRNKTNSL